MKKTNLLLIALLLICSQQIKAQTTYPYDVSKAAYLGFEENFYVGSQESSPADLVFTPDGMKMFVLGTSGDDINEYNLSTAYDVSTAVFAGDTEKFYVGSQESTPYSLTFTPDGTKMFVGGSSGDDINEYTLSTSFDVSTAVYAGDAERFYVGNEVGLIISMVFNSEGTKMFVLDFSGDYIYQYTLSVAYDVSTAVHDGNEERFYIGSQENNPFSLRFTPNGITMFVLGRSGDDINQYTLSTAYDISTAIYDGAEENLYVGSEEADPWAMAFNVDGTKLFVMGQSGDDINEYAFINLAPDISGTRDNQIFNNLGVVNLFETVNVADVNQDLLSAIITLDDNEDGVLSGTGLTGSGPYTIASMTASELQSVIQSLVFDPSADSEETTTFTLEVNDGELTTTDNITTVTAVEDPSVVSIAVDGNPGSTATTVDFIVTFDESVTRVDQNDFILNKSSLVTGSITSFSGEEDSYTLTVSGISGHGVLSLDLESYGTGIRDESSNDITGGFIGDVHLVGNAYDVSQASYTGADENFYVGSQENNPIALAFNPTGTKMFVMGTSGDDINEYALSTAYDVSTAVYAERFYIGGEESNPYSLTFSPDGKKMFVMGTSNDNINEYTLSTAYDISTAGYAGETENFYVGSIESNPTSMVFNTDGSKMFVLGTSDYVHEFTLSISYDVSTSIYSGVDKRFYVGSQEGNPFSMFFGPNGTIMYILGTNNDAIKQYTLSSAYDVFTAVYDGTNEDLYVGNEETNPYAMTFNTDGTKLFVMGAVGDDINEYDLINVAPEISGALGDQTVNDLDDIVLFASIEITDDNVDDLVSATITLDNNDNGVLSGTSLSGSGPYSVVSTTLTELQEILRGLIFSPTDDSKKTTIFTLEVSDGDLTAIDDNTSVTAISNPSVISLILDDPDSYATSLDFTITFNESVENVDESDFIIYKSSFVTGDITSFSGADAIYTVTVSGVSGDGFLSLDLASSGTGIRDEDSNSLIEGGIGYTHTVGNAYDVSRAEYAGSEEAFYVGGEEASPSSLTFTPDGSKMFVMGESGDDINEYSLSTPYDASTAVFAGDSEKFYVGSQETRPYSLTFNPDGMKMFVLGRTGDDINIYGLTDAYDVSTATYEDRFYIGTEESSPTSMVFNDDGMKMFVMGYSGDDINQYTLSVAYDISTALYDGADENFYVGSQESNPYSLTFGPGGIKMYVMGSSGDDINQYTLSTAYDVSTAVFDGNEERLYVGSEEGTPLGMAFNTDGTKLFVMGSTGDNVNEYDLLNFAPILNIETADTEATEDVFFSLTIDEDNFEDPNASDELELTAELEGGDDLPDWLSFDSEDWEFTGTPGDDDIATLSIVVTATDPGGLSATDVFTVEVININDQHTVNAVSNQTIDEEDELILTVTVEDEDVNNPDYTYSLDAASTALDMSIDDDGEFSWTPDELQGGTSHDVTITVADDENSDFVIFTINVEESNSAPTLSITNRGIVSGEELAFTIQAIDTDNPVQTLTYTLDATSLGKGMTLDANTGDFSWTPDETQASEIHEVTASVNDGFVTINKTFGIASPNQEPSFNEGDDQTVLEDAGPQLVNSWATAISDGDAGISQRLTFNVSSDNNALFSARPEINEDGDLTYTPAANANGSATVTVTLSDNWGSLDGGDDTSDEERFTITVTSVDDAPTISEIEDQETVKNGSVTGIDFVVDDADNDPLQVSVASNNTSLVSSNELELTAVDNDYELSITPISDQFGTANVTVTVSDGVLSTTTVFLLTVTGSETVLAAVDMEDLRHGINLYPVPASNVLKVDMPKDVRSYVIMIHDLEGRKLEYRSIEINAGIETHEFDVSNYKNGLYFMEIETQNSTVQKSFIIQR